MVLTLIFSFYQKTASLATFWSQLLSLKLIIILEDWNYIEYDEGEISKD